MSLSTSASPEVDAYDYTFGVSQLNIGTSGKLSITRSAITSESNLDDAQKAHLADLCRDISFGNSASEPSDSINLASGSPLFVFWRSHYPAPIKGGLNSILATGDIRCSVNISSSDGDVDIVFNPVPSSADNLSGTSSPTEAIDEVLMMIDSAQTGTVLNDDHNYEIIPVKEAAEVVLNVKGLHASDITVSASDSETTCKNHDIEGEVKLGNPDEIQSFSYALTSSEELEVSEIYPSSSGGRNLEACNNAVTEATDTGFTLGVSCASYMEIQEQGQGDTCGFAAAVSNTADPRNSISSKLRMSGLDIETLDVSTASGAYEAIIKSDKNPVRLNTVDVSSFNVDQSTSLEKAFDYWIAASPKSYTDFWEGNMAKINYLGNTQDCAIQGVLAFVTSLDTDEMFWCELAGMRAQDISEQGSPLVLMLIAVTALHENLHAVGREHDFDELNFEPCKGTSEAAVLSFDTVINCKEGACYGMRDLAIQEYIVELDYSLQGDARRFDGQCQVWNDGLGLAQGDFAP